MIVSKFSLLSCLVGPVTGQRHGVGPLVGESHPLPGPGDPAVPPPVGPVAGQRHVVGLF